MLLRVNTRGKSKG